MRRIFIAACIASGCTLSTLSGTAVTNEEWTELLRTSRCSEDLIVLTNGSKLCGKFTELPPLTFSFGTVSFKPEEVAAIGIISRDQQVKVQYMTYDGQNFIGSLDGKRFVFALRDTKDLQHFILREIDGSEISFILLAKNSTKPIVQNRNLFHFTMQNGDHISAYIESGKLHLTNGWKESTLDPQNIIEVCFNGGLQGQVSKGGYPQDLGYQFVKESTISIHVPHKDVLVRLPWQQIASIQAANHSDEWPEEVISSANPISHLSETAKPRTIGNTFGKMLTEASGAIIVPAQMFATLDDVGNEPVQSIHDLEEPPALFTSAEEGSWDLHIAFVDEPEPLFDGSEENDWKMNIAFVEEPAPLFDGSEENDWMMNIAFVEEPAPLFDGAEENDWKLNIAFVEEPAPLFDTDEEKDWQMTNIAFENSNPQLFDHAEESTWAMSIAFDEDLFPGEITSAELAQLDERELRDLFVRYDQRHPAQVDNEENLDLIEQDDEQDLQETLAEVQEEEAFIEELLGAAEENETAPSTANGFFVEEDFLVLPGSLRDRPAYQTTWLPTYPEPLLYTRIAGFHIDEAPVTNRQYAEFVAATGHASPKHWEGDTPPAGQEDRPVVLVSYNDATAYAAWEGKRLPNEIEWSLALEQGLIVEDPSFAEWTATSAPEHKKVIIKENGTIETLPGHIQSNLTFRTLTPLNHVQ